MRWHLKHIMIKDVTGGGGRGGGGHKKQINQPKEEGNRQRHARQHYFDRESMRARGEMKLRMIEKRKSQRIEGNLQMLVVTVIACIES
jgi:hypothetical protein